MTHIQFYSNVADPYFLVSQLVQKALNQHHQVTIFMESQLLATTLSDYLWAQEPVTFIPNTLATEAVTKTSPVVICWQDKAIIQDDVLINMQTAQPIFFSRFRQLIEIVSLDEVHKIEGRKRYTFYRDRGYDIKHVDMLKKSI